MNNENPSENPETKQSLLWHTLKNKNRTYLWTHTGGKNIFFYDATETYPIFLYVISPQKVWEQTQPVAWHYYMALIL